MSTGARKYFCAVRDSGNSPIIKEHVPILNVRITAALLKTS
jgi:hypothetical protein